MIWFRCKPIILLYDSSGSACLFVWFILGLRMVLNIDIVPKDKLMHFNIRVLGSFRPLWFSVLIKYILWTYNCGESNFLV